MSDREGGYEDWDPTPPEWLVEDEGGPVEDEGGGSQSIVSVADWQHLVQWRPPKGGPVIIPTAVAAGAILALDPTTAGALAWDVSLHAARWTRTLQIGGLAPIEAGQVLDVHAVAVQGHLARITGATWTIEAIHQGIAAAAAAQPRDPVAEYLTALRWDGVPRVSSWAETYLGAAPGPYGAWWLQQCVARALDPGCQADYILTLEGDQGLRKTTIIRSLCPTPDWYGSLTVDLTDYVRAASSLRGYWIVEFEELAAARKRDSEAQKAFISRRRDDYRAAYARHEVSHPRRCCFIGSTNADVYLHDPTGARRYWPIRCGALDVDGVVRDRDQLWAEAVARHKQGLPRWPATREEHAAQREAAEERREADPWEDPMRDMARGREEVSSREVLLHLVPETERHTPIASARVAKCAKALGWTPARDVCGKRGSRGYRMPVEVEAAPVAPPPPADEIRNLPPMNEVLPGIDEPRIDEPAWLNGG